MRFWKAFWCFGICALALLAALACNARAGQLEDVDAALDQHDYVTAKRLLVPLAKQGNAKAQRYLGWMYEFGHGVPENHEKAFRWYLKAAENGDLVAQGQVGWSYRWDQKDYSSAAYWYSRAALQGSVSGQYILGEMYEEGQGVAQDFVQAHMWYNLAAANPGNGVFHDTDASFSESARKARDKLAASMTRGQVAKAQRLAQEWLQEHPNQEQPDKEAMAPQESPRTEPTVSAPRLASSGTGFFVSTEGHVLTNAHVVEGCSQVRLSSSSALSGRSPAVLVAQNRQDDLALLKADYRINSPASFRSGPLPSLGEAVVVFGFPLAGVLASSGNLTSGQISALAGLGDDTRYYQISAPVQPGNSGGALLDGKANVIGVVVSKLDAVKAAAATGDIPQNVNFAIKGSIALNFMEAHSVRLRMSTSIGEISAVEVAAQAQRFTVKVECLK